MEDFIEVGLSIFLFTGAFMFLTISLWFGIGIMQDINYLLQEREDG